MVGPYRLSHAAPDYGVVYDRTYDSGFYKAQWETIERPLLTGWFERLRGEGRRSLLDFACGTGRVTNVAESFFPRVVGVDVSSAMLGQARAVCRTAELIHRDITVTPLGEQFDVATAFRFFLNAEAALRSEALHAIRGALRPGGVLVANVHVNSTSPLGLAYRLRNRLHGRQANTLGYPEMRRMLVEVGFEVEQVLRYSALPRLGWFFPPGSRPLMSAFEAVLGAMPASLQGYAQSFLIQARLT